MLNSETTVVDYVIKEIKSCMAFTPILYLETEDRALINQLLNRKDCFAIFRREDETVKFAEYTDDDDKINVVNIVKTLESKFPKPEDNTEKKITSWGGKPLYFIVKDFSSIDGSSQKKLIRDYIKLVFEKNSEIPLKQNLIIISPKSMSVGDDPENSVPTGYEQYIHTIDVPLLGIKDIAEQIVVVQNKSLQQLQPNGGKSITVEEYMTKPDSYIYEFKGLSRYQIEYVLYELQNNIGAVSKCGIPQNFSAKIKESELNKLAKQLINKQKMQNASKNGDIEYVDTSEIVIPGGMDGVAEWIKRKKNILDYPNRVKNYSMRFPKGILMAGLPGSGKSLTAKYVAKEFNLPLIQFKMDMVLQGIVGSSEQRIKQVLKLFEASAPCVIWIDEIEKELAGMNGSGDNDSGVNKRCLAKLLNWMQENKEQCFIFATANRTTNLPQELLRRGRFDRLYYSFLPMKEQCVDIMLNHILKIKKNAPYLLDDSVTKSSVRAMGDRLFSKISNYEHRFFTGSDIEGLVSDVKDMMFQDMSRDISDGKSSYSINELEELLLQVAKGTITYAESNYDEVIEYWIGLKSHQFYNAAVKEFSDDKMLEQDLKYKYMLFDFSDLQYDGSNWNWRKGLKCFSDHPYDKNMFDRLSKSIKKRMQEKTTSNNKY